MSNAKAPFLMPLPPVSGALELSTYGPLTLLSPIISVSLHQHPNCSGLFRFAPRLCAIAVSAGALGARQPTSGLELQKGSVVHAQPDHPRPEKEREGVHRRTFTVLVLATIQADKETLR